MQIGKHAWVQKYRSYHQDSVSWLCCCALGFILQPGSSHTINETNGCSTNYSIKSRTAQPESQAHPCVRWRRWHSRLVDSPTRTIRPEGGEGPQMKPGHRTHKEKRCPWQAQTSKNEMMGKDDGKFCPDFKMLWNTWHRQTLWAAFFSWIIRWKQL